MSKAKKKTTRKHDPPVVGQENNQARANVPLSESQMDGVAQKVAEKLLPLLPGSASGNSEVESNMVYDANPGCSSVSLPMTQSTPTSSSPMSGGVQIKCSGISGHVSPSLKQKIWNGEYINLSKLIFQESSKQVFSIDSKGEISLAPKASKQISTIEVWTDAFIVFIDIFCQLNSNQYAALYLHTIRLGARQYSSYGWLSYDEQFRIKKARCFNTSWGTVDQELWLLFMCRPAKQLARPSSGLKCFYYNYKGVCSKALCNFSHICIRCSGKHSKKSCSLYKRKSDASFSFRSKNGNGAPASQSKTFSRFSLQK